MNMTSCLNRSRPPAARVAWMWTLAALGIVCGGCGNWWYTSFLDPTRLSAGFQRPMISEIQQSLTFEDAPPGIPGAEEPTAEDTVAQVEEYRLGAGDSIQLRILDFVSRGVETVLDLTLNDVGNIQVPQLGWIHVLGMTGPELEEEIRDRAIQAGIFQEGSQPIIQVTFLTQRQRMFNIVGAVTTPGPYRILEPDFRLMDALALAGGLPEQVEWIYVYRSQPRPTRTITARSRGADSRPTAPAAPPVESTAPPVTPAAMSTLGFGAGGMALAQASPPPSTGSSPVATEQELIEAIAPPAVRKPASEPSPSQPASEPAALPSGAPKFIFLNGQWVDVSQQQAAGETTRPAAGKREPAQTDGTPATLPTTEPVQWETVATEDRQRIIRIPVDALRKGDARYNIVIRHRDMIRVDPGPVGEFYLMGNVARPGAFSLTGRQVTLKQAIAAVGGLDQLAWPSRCEIIRRLDQDREQIIPVNLEQIFAGQQPDVYLRPNDIINVGTHIVAPFLATVRSSFRMSYGFGFVYDRNFGDIDAYGPKVNPQNTDVARREARRTRLGLW